MRNIGLALLASAAVAACGGGDGGGNPPPTGGSGGGGTPTPTPPPTFSYTKFADVTGDVTFPNACISYETINGFPQWALSKQFGDSGSIRLNTATETWTITNFADSSQQVQFGPSVLVSSDAQQTVYQTSPASGPPDYLRIFGTPAGEVEREYSRILAYGIPSTGSPAQAVCTIGIPTDPDDIPDQTAVTYTDLLFGGFVLDRVPGGNPPIAQASITGGTGTITGNTTNGTIAFDLSLEITDTSNVVSTIGPFTGTVDVTVNSELGLYGGRLDFGGRQDVELVGGFYGPQGTETGAIFAVNVDANSDGTVDQLIFASVTGKR